MAMQPPPYDGANRPGYPPVPGAGPPGGAVPAPPPGYGAPPPRTSKRIWWIVGGSVAGGLALCCVGLFLMSTLFGVGIFKGVSSVAGNVSGAQAAATGYFGEVRGHNWVGARDYLDASLRARTPAAAIEASWTRTEAANGRVTSFSATNTNISTNNGRTTATVTGTVRYATGTTEEKIVRLVKEGDAWRLPALP